MKRSTKRGGLLRRILLGIGFLGLALLFFGARNAKWTEDDHTARTSMSGTNSANLSGKELSASGTQGLRAVGIGSEITNTSRERADFVALNKQPKWPTSNATEVSSHLKSLIDPLVPLKNIGIYRGETQQEMSSRLLAWAAAVTALQNEFKKNHVVSAWPISGSVGCDMFRTALELSDTLYVSTVVPVLHCNPNFADVVQSCSVAERSVKCSFQYRPGRQLLLTLSSKTTSQMILVTTQHGSFQIPVERPTIEREGQLHVCVQSIFYPEELFGPMPDEHLETFIGHYSRLGASDVHIYTNSTVLADSKRRIKVPKNTRVWYHDTPLPTLSISRSFIAGVEYGFQYFAINDCLMRAKAMRASVAIFLDFDEFAFPYANKAVGLSRLQDILALENIDTSQGLGNPSVIWMQSYMFNTLMCSNSPAGEKPDWYHNFLDHFSVAQLDSATYQGRRKSAFILNGISAETLAFDVWYQVHDIAVPNSVSQRMSTMLHIHHYREAWHARVCSQKAESATTPWVSHRGCDKYLEPVSSVWEAV